MPRRSSTGIAQRVGYTAALSRVWYWSLFVGLYSMIPVVVGDPWNGELDASAFIDAGIGVTIGFLLVFRMNRAYERWWEARSLWGTLVNVSRNLAIKTREIANADAIERAQMRRLIVGFAYGLKNHLRTGAALREVPGFADSDDDPRHVPSYISGQVYTVFAAWRASDRITGEELIVLDRESRALMDVTGGCEKIKNTLMSQSFPTLVRQAMVLYFLYVPWSLAPDLGWFAVPISVFVSYFVVGVEGIAYYVERPFGRDEDHLDLEEICVGIDVSVTEILEA
jgi:putative membrane protein